MSDMPPPDGGARGKPADGVLAAELALGVLDAPSLLRAQTRAASDDAFAADAAAWSQRLYPLIEEIAPVEPSERLWPRIAGAAGLDATIDLRLGPTAAPFRTSEAASGPVAVKTEAGARDNVVPLRRSGALAAWRAAAIGGFALAAASLAAVAYLVTATHPVIGASPLLAAKLAPVSSGPTIIGSEPLFTATLDRTRGAVVMTPISPGPVDPRVRELWLIPKGGKPVAAGLLDTAHIKPVPLSRDLLKLAQAGATLAISLEPPGGSPTGAPTGPVIAAGELAQI